MSRPAPNKEALPIANGQQSSIDPEISWQFFLPRLVQNLRLRTDCNLIPTVHRTQHLSSQSNHWTKGFHFTEIFSIQRSPSGEVR